MEAVKRDWTVTPVYNCYSISLPETASGIL